MTSFVGMLCLSCIAVVAGVALMITGMVIDDSLPMFFGVMLSVAGGIGCCTYDHLKEKTNGLQ